MQQYNQIPPHPPLTNRSSQPVIYNPNANYQQNIQMKPNPSGQTMPNYSSRLSLANMQSMQSMQTMTSSDSLSRQPSQSNIVSQQTFPVIYNDSSFMVDPIALGQASGKFKKLIQPFINSNQRIADLHLKVLVHNFTNRNMNNFLKLCQNLPTDVQDSEMEEICDIAKLFEADQIYYTGIAFIHSVIDPNFNVPDEKYNGSDGKTYLIIEGETRKVHHLEDLSDLDFASDNANNTGSNNQQNVSTSNQILNTNNSSVNDQNSNKNAQNIEYTPNDQPVLNNKNDRSVLNNENKNDQVLNDPNSPQKKENTTQAESSNHEQCVKSVVYQVRVEPHAFKCHVYHFCANGRIMFTAKMKDFNIYIGEGSNVHITKNTDNHVGHIFQVDSDHNLIRLKSIQFRLQYVNSGKPGHVSIDVSFPFQDQELRWMPMTPKYDPNTDNYYLNYSGEYQRHPIKSRRNIVLQNLKGHPTFIVRKVEKHVYEIECLSIIDPLIAFTIGLSDIIGPPDVYIV